MPIIRTEKLTHIYSTGTPFERTAIKDISFSAEKGEFIGIIGQTGSGKSTFIQHLNGLLKPESGEIYFNEINIYEDKKTTHSIRGKVGLVFQYPEYQLFEETVYKDIAFGPKNMQLGEREIDERVRESAAFVGLDESILQKSPFELSGGQKRRAAIAGVIAMRPEVLILDEPTAGLDPRGQENILGNISKYHSLMGSTVIMVTHSMEEIARMVDRLVVFSGGSIVMDGAPSDIFLKREELQKLGLSVPEVTKIAMNLEKMGISLGPVFTIEQAVDAIMKLRGRRID